jgi:sec-independent protein translocase protein TatB
MNVFGVGPAELVLILIVALIFVGPERLPRMAADIARTIREIRKYTSSFAAEFNDVIKEFEKETETERAEWKEIGEGLSSATKDLTAEVDSANQAVKESTTVGAPTPPAGAVRPIPGANGTANGNGANPAEPAATSAETTTEQRS